MKPGSFLKDSGSESLEHAEHLLNIAFSQMRTSEEAEDVVQEACLRALRFFPGFRGDDGRAWFMKIVRNTCYTLSHSSRKHRDAAEFDENLLSSTLAYPIQSKLYSKMTATICCEKHYKTCRLIFGKYLFFGNSRRCLTGRSHTSLACPSGR